MGTRVAFRPIHRTKQEALTVLVLVAEKLALFIIAGYATFVLLIMLSRAIHLHDVEEAVFARDLYYCIDNAVARDSPARR